MYKNQWYHVQDRGALFLKQSFGIWSLNNNYRKHQEKDPEKLGNEVTVLVNYLQWILKPFFFSGETVARISIIDSHHRIIGDLDYIRLSIIYRIPFLYVFVCIC